MHLLGYLRVNRSAQRSLDLISVLYPKLQEQNNIVQYNKFKARKGLKVRAARHEIDAEEGVAKIASGMPTRARNLNDLLMSMMY